MHEQITERIIGAAIEVHRALGPGLLESAYEACLCHQMSAAGIAFQRQIELPIEFNGLRVESGYRLDLLVEEQVIVELKSIESLLPIHDAQLLTYLKLSRKRVGLLINFNVNILKDGIRRRIV